MGLVFALSRIESSKGSSSLISYGISSGDAGRSVIGAQVVLIGPSEREKKGGISMYKFLLYRWCGCWVLCMLVVGVSLNPAGVSPACSALSPLVFAGSSAAVVVELMCSAFGLSDQQKEFFF
ncbi:hypothetical protein C2G38_2030648 [Gigaspora rosea]|uniref:Uncharacterized protein n=1 Tax=Gigaspora rosea TaxID=44941 RepID=A0A397VTN4_9GLOM|nr:hypothetical protein C2G38_2030648 [Gigaspora rosea]